jgi:C_GCAxxG_C_C family probable redox protein
VISIKKELVMVKAVSLEERKELLDRVEQRAFSYQYEFRGCGRSLVLALQEEFELPGGTAALKAASLAGLGIGRLGLTCGALIGSVVAMGLAHGPENIEDALFPQQENTDPKTGNPKSIETMRTFINKFEEYMGGLNCKDIQLKMLGKTYNTINPEENKVFGKASHEKCAERVGKVARMCAEAIMDMPPR